MSLNVYIAGHPNDIAETYHLVSSRYQDAGYGSPSEPPRGKTLFAKHPHVAIAARQDGKLVATLSVFPDTPNGLPLETAFPLEVTGLRSHGMTLAEMGSLASVPGTGLLGGSPVLEQMVSLAVRYHFGRGGNTIVVAVHPKHQEFYVSKFGFQMFGAERPYASVQNHPAVALVVTKSQLEKACPGITGGHSYV